ncbi:hypothetical protein M407DRAFT_31624 [Tulasnella calospora MUT 4182]|uniref:Uncharacterized protein n=1 Tax=Tulasnella calospora MUT 4182 TaxID=1051891 RepID=A0A0C3Q5B2_9AGAM|nr:hypothetical protein M407DRAFT_31624 [Tulasnella calospora MUT 4182]
MEALCIRAIRLQLWDSHSSRVPRRPSRCIPRPENSVTWLSICYSRWLVVQLNGGVLEFWDLEDGLGVSPRVCFGGVNGIINGGKMVYNFDGKRTLVISTRSDLAYALKLHLPLPGIPASDPRIQLVRSWAGYSELLDATHPLWAFARTSTGQIATVLHSLSDRSVSLVGIEDDELDQCNLSGAVQIGQQSIAIARTHSLDIYDMDSVFYAFNSSRSDGTPAIKPSQSLEYPRAWTGSGLTFISNRPSWSRLKTPRRDEIYLSFTEDDLRTSIGLVAYKEDEGDIYQFEQPYHLLGAENQWTTAFRWGELARRMVYVVGRPRQVFLHGTVITSDPSALQHDRPKINRTVHKWTIPHGERDFFRYLAFDEPTGVSAIAMASGNVWVTDPNPSAVEASSPSPQKKLICSDPPWPSTHPVPWARRTAKGQNRIEVLQDIRGWSSSVEQVFPGKNRPNCFGGATWFLNEVLHIQGSAEVFLFATSRSLPYPHTELVRLGNRVLVIRRHQGKGVHEAWLLDADSTAESVKAHLHADGTIDQLTKTKLAVDELPARRYAAWRHRVEPIEGLHL